MPLPSRLTWRHLNFSVTLGGNPHSLIPATLLLVNLARFLSRNGQVAAPWRMATSGKFVGGTLPTLTTTAGAVDILTTLFVVARVGLRLKTLNVS